jgi:hypothetical protein
VPTEASQTADIVIPAKIDKEKIKLQPRLLLSKPVAMQR